MSESFFSKVDEPAVVEAIANAERRSRGEIRVHVASVQVVDVIKDATETFERLGMTVTAERNGVLIFVAAKSQKFAVLADSGVTSIVGMLPLDQIASGMSIAFREGRFTEGLVAAIERAGDLLATHFPRIASKTDENELPNEISRG